MTVEDGIAITTVPRTLFDLAALKGPRALERAIHESEVRRLWDRLSLHDILARYPNRPGAPAVRHVLGKRARPAITENDFEESFYEFLVDRGLPLPTFNQPLFIDGRWLRPDCTWPEHNLIAELDGRQSHDTHAAYESDRERDRDLLVAGWRSTRITWRQLRYGPRKLERDLRALLGA
jgi:very-short-patch-repair endonuclease